MATRRVSAPVDEIECPRCGGRGSLVAPAGHESYNLPNWSADQGKITCGQCKGEGFVLKPRKGGETRDRKFVAFAAPEREQIAPATWDEAQESYDLRALPEPQDEEMTREQCFAAAVNIYSMSCPCVGRNMKHEDIIPFAREIERYRRGD